jgi:thioredoxin reductase
MGSGIRMNTEGYILVDERMQTNVENIFACGDCVNFPLPGQSNGPSNSQRRANIPHWQIAQCQGSGFWMTKQ